MAQVLIWGKGAYFGMWRITHFRFSLYLYEKADYECAYYELAQ